MCESCYWEAGSPTDESPHMPEVVRLLGELYGMTSTGGPLHVIVDDWNLEDEFLEPYWRDDDPPELRRICTELLGLLKAMTVPERYAALARCEGWRPA